MKQTVYCKFNQSRCPAYATKTSILEENGRKTVLKTAMTEEGRALQERAKDVPLNVSQCIELPPEKARMLYELLYELLGNQTGGKAKNAE